MLGDAPETTNLSLRPGDSPIGHAADRRRRICARGSRRQEGSATRATVSADGETILVHIPLTFRKRGGRKLVVTPDGAEWAPRHATLLDLARAKGIGKTYVRSCG